MVFVTYTLIECLRVYHKCGKLQVFDVRLGGDLKIWDGHKSYIYVWMYLVLCQMFSVQLFYSRCLGASWLRLRLRRSLPNSNNCFARTGRVSTTRRCFSPFRPASPAIRHMQSWQLNPRIRAPYAYANHTAHLTLAPSNSN